MSSRSCKGRLIVHTINLQVALEERKQKELVPVYNGIGNEKFRS